MKHATTLAVVITQEFIRDQLPLGRRDTKSEFGQKSIDFLNMISNVEWQISKPIVDLADQLRIKGISLGSMQAVFRDPRLDAGMPQHIVDSTEEDKKDWRREMKHLHEQHEKQRRKSIRSRQALTMAQEFSQHDHFYLSWSYDYRGRCYSQQPWLQPQTTEMEKSIIEFSKGQALTDQGELWAAQAVGAAFLGSTQAFKDRTSWTLENKELIKAIAADPIGTMSYWEHCKEPWQFLQLATEWNDVILTRAKNLWHVPIGADATSSGLQLLSAMLRDPVGMKYANVLPPESLYDPPQDAYLAVLGVARQKALQAPETAYLAEFMVHRNIGKVIMVDLYGASHGTIRDRIIKVFRDRKEFGKEKLVSWHDCDKMAKLVAEAARGYLP